jgi:UDP-N-acetylmuramyl pentapeptide phosphotransferase/UDP-N-acetylglucosamine-1-phosphate transferase
MEWFEYIAGVFVLLTGMYLSYYWYNGIRDKTGTSSVISGTTSWQESLSRFIQRNQTTVVVLSSIVIAAAVGFAVFNKQRRQPG